MRKSLLPALVLLPVLVACGSGSNREPTSPDAVRLDHLAFAPATKSIPVGGTVQFVNTGSRAVHVLVPGEDAQPRPADGAPSFGGAAGIRTEVGERWTSPPWNTPGTYRITCTLHPSMNMTIVVG